VVARPGAAEMLRHGTSGSARLVMGNALLSSANYKRNFGKYFRLSRIVTQTLLSITPSSVEYQILLLNWKFCADKSSNSLIEIQTD